MADAMGSEKKVDRRVRFLSTHALLCCSGRPDQQPDVPHHFAFFCVSSTALLLASPRLATPRLASASAETRAARAKSILTPCLVISSRTRHAVSTSK